MSGLHLPHDGPAVSAQGLLSAIGDGPPPCAVHGPCDAALLRRVEAALAAQVGPIASVLVRRTAPACDTLVALCAQLAEQVTAPPRAAGRPAPGGEGPATIPDALIAASAGVLARTLGPIAWVVARRAARSAPDRPAYFDRLEASLSDARQRQAMRAQLDRLR